jgi:hypothetical protein
LSILARYGDEKRQERNPSSFGIGAEPATMVSTEANGENLWCTDQSPNTASLDAQ